MRVEYDFMEVQMKLSVFYDHILVASEQTGYELLDILKKVNELGIEGVECDIEHIRSCKEELKKKLGEAKIKVASVYGFFDFGNNLDYEKGYTFIDDAAYFRAGRVLVIPGFVEEKEGEVYQMALSNMVDVLNKICDYAETKNIVVTLEDFDHHTAPFSTDEELIWFMERVPKLRCTFDTGNFMYSEVNELKAFELLKDKIVHVHCKDRALVPVSGEEPTNTIAGRGMYTSPVGYGSIQMKEIVNRLKEINYEGFLAIEHFGSQNQIEYIEKSANWILSNI